MTNEELLNKWKSILDYTGEDTPPLTEFKRLYLATLMENYEYFYLKNPNNKDSNLIKCVIPQMRKNGGPLHKVLIDDQQWDIVIVKTVEGKYKTYAFNPDNVIVVSVHHPAYREKRMGNCWEWNNEKREWEWVK